MNHVLRRLNAVRDGLDAALRLERIYGPFRPAESSTPTLLEPSGAFLYHFQMQTLHCTRKKPT